MPKEHRYTVTVAWTGNADPGTMDVRTYSRDHEIQAEGKPSLPGSTDPAFRGDPARWNPEELFVAALSTCHMLWYLHLCADAKIVVVAYADRPEGTLVEGPQGRFTGVVLRPQVRLAPGSDGETARQLHAEAHRRCFIANSVSCPVEIEPEIVPAPAD